MQANRRIVLEGLSFTIGKLVIEQGGQDDLEIQSSLNNLVSNLAGTSSAVMDVIPENTGKGADYKRGLFDAAREGSPNTPPAKTRKTGNRKAGSKSFIESLIETGYFSQERSLADVQSELERKGHRFEQKAIAPSLQSLTKSGQLSRQKHQEEKVWMYKKS